MASISNKKSVMAFVEETTEGTPKLPTLATDFIPLQEGFSLSPAFEELENNELSGSIGRAKTVLGGETPTASVSCYLKGSGVEGVAPRVGKLLKALFGIQSINSTERVTDAGSSAGTASARAIVKVAAGGSDFARGKAILIKDATNGYSIRNVNSNNTAEELNLNFNLNSAPNAGIGLGKCINYAPAEDNHPTNTITVYRGNGGAIEMEAGVRVIGGNLIGQARQYINGEFELEGIEYFFNPIELTSSNNDLDYVDSDGTNTVAIPVKVYKDPIELAEAIGAALNGGSTDTFTVSYSSSTGKYTITSDGTTFELSLQSGPNAPSALGELLGFDVTADVTGELTYTGNDALDLSAPVTPTFDNTQPVVAKSNEVRFGDFDDNVCFGASNISINFANTKTNIENVCSDSGISGSIISAREVTIELSALLSQYDSEKFYKFRTGSNVEFMWNFGEKVGGSWKAGTIGNFYMPSSTITAYELIDTDGLVTLNMTLGGYVANGLGEAYFNNL